MNEPTEQARREAEALCACRICIEDGNCSRAIAIATALAAKDAEIAELKSSLRTEQIRHECQHGLKDVEIARLHELLKIRACDHVWKPTEDQFECQRCGKTDYAVDRELKIALTTQTALLREAVWHVIKAQSQLSDYETLIAEQEARKFLSKPAIVEMVKEVEG